MATDKVYYATGRRKSSSARVFLTAGEGKFTINGKELETYMPMVACRWQINQPLELTGQKNSFNIYVTVTGGGFTGQAGAITHALSRALVVYDEGLRHQLKQAGLLSRDPRMVERKKYGRHKARRSTQFSKR